MTPRRRVVLLVLLTAALWSPAVSYSAMFEDEQVLSLARGVFQQPWGPAAFWGEPWFGPASPAETPRFYRPLPKLHLAIDETIAGGPGPLRDLLLHTSNLILYCGIVVLLYAVMQRLGVPSRARWIAAAAFAVHPIHGESVVWIIGRTDLWSSLWIMSSLAAALALQVRAGSPRLQRIRWVALPVMTFLAGSSKETAATIPALIAVAWFAAARVRGRQMEWRRLGAVLLAAAIPLAIVVVIRAAAIGVATYPVELSPFGPGRLTAWERVQTALFACRIYVWHTFVPLTLTFHYELRNEFVPWIDAMPLGGWGGVAAVVAWTAFAGLGIWGIGRREPRWRVAGAGIALFFITFLPISHVVIPHDPPIADRFLFLPSAFLAVMLGGLLSRASRGTIAAAAAFCVWWAAVAVWDMPRMRDDVSVWQAAIRVDPSCYTARTALAYREHAAGNHAEALDHARVAILRGAQRRGLFLIAMSSMEALGLNWRPGTMDEYQAYRQALSRLPAPP